MRRCLLVVGIFAFAISAVICEAAEEKACSTKDKEISGDPGSGILGINLFKPRQARPLGEDEGPGVSTMGVMPPGQTYDQVTGLPNIVKSDSLDEIQ